MNIRELKRRLLPYSGYLKPDEDGATGGGATAEESLDLGNDLAEESAAPAAAPSAAPAPATTAAPDASGGGVDDGDDSGKPGGGIPRARFNEVNDRRKALESENEALRAQLAASSGGRGAATPAPAPAAAPQQATVDVDALEEQYTQALLDGDSKAAVALRKQINKHIEDTVVQRFEQASAGEKAQALVTEAVEQMLEQFPWLDTEDGAEALDLIEASAAMKMQRGLSKAQALREAVQAIAPKFTPDQYRVGQGGASSGDIRTQRANQRGAAHSLLQPAAVQAGMGNRAVAPKIDETTKLTDAQIEGLSQAELDKALGTA